MHCYQIGTNSWYNIESQKLDAQEFRQLVTAGQIPQHFALLQEPKIRFGHTAVINQHYMYIFGGWDGQMTLNDLSIFDLNLRVWLQPAQLQGCIEGRYRHTSCAT